jgi:hypothetical protein
VTLPVPLCRTLRSFWSLVHPSPSTFTLSTLSAIRSLFVPVSSFSFLFFFSRTHTSPFRVSPLSPRVNLRQPPYPRCIMMISLPLLSPSLHRPRCTTLVAPSSLHRPCCTHLAAPSSLHPLRWHPPRSIVLAPSSHLRTSYCWLCVVFHEVAPHLICPHILVSSSLFSHVHFLVPSPALHLRCLI